MFFDENNCNILSATSSLKGHGHVGPTRQVDNVAYTYSVLLARLLRRLPLDCIAFESEI